jgi:hypothetical protein
MLGSGFGFVAALHNPNVRPNRRAYKVSRWASSKTLNSGSASFSAERDPVRMVESFPTLQCETYLKC